MKLIRHIIHVFLISLITTVAYAQTESELKEDANKLFEKEQYVDATSLYLRLLSLNPKNEEYNYRYGTCLLFNSYQKKDALRYLNFATKQTSIDPRAYYFYGKALHLNYQFDEAIKNYKVYLTKRENRDKRYTVEREIEMCQNGKKLLTTFTDIIVSEKKEIDQEKFFRLYNNMETVGGDILVSENFQSKLDKKMGHTPIVHYPAEAKAIYYSSYGETGSTGKDIYVRRRLPDGKWGEPQRVQGGVNSSEDEDFPFMHSSGDFLFFSSKGHNSMGGYDIFMSRFDPLSNTFKKPENVDFAISSPDDDLFYVVDETFQNAYFASSRQSQNGKLHVYNVRVARVPIREVIVMGNFLSEINPDNKSMTINVSKYTNGESVGKIKSNNLGKFSFVFPQGGKYNYEVTVEGSSDIFKYVIELPFLDAFRPLKQKALHTTIDGQEIVKIINLFDEEVDGAEALMAEVIRKKASLDVNVDNFDLKEIDAQQERNKVLAELGFNNMSMREVSDQLEELAITEKLNKQKVALIESNINAEIIEKSELIEGYNAQLNTIESKISNATTPADKYVSLSEALRIESERVQLANEIKKLSELKNQALATTSGNDGNSKVEVLESQFNALIAAEKEDEALLLLSKSKSEIIKANNDSPDAIVEGLIEKSVTVSKKVKTLKQEELGYEKSIDELKSSIILLNNSLPNAKKKNYNSIKEDIANKESELELVIEMRDLSQKSIESKNKELSILDNNIASMQKAMLNDNTAAVNEADVHNSINKIEEIINGDKTENYLSDLAALEEVNPELSPDYVSIDPIDTATDPVLESQVAAIELEQENLAKEINENNDLSEEEKLSQLVANNEASLNKVNDRLKEVESQLAKNPSSSDLKEELASLNKLNNDLSEENGTYQDEIAELNGTADPIDVALSQDDVLDEIIKDYSTDVKSVNDNTTYSEKEKLIELQLLDEKAVIALVKEQEKLSKAIAQDSEDQELVARNDMISSILNEKQEIINERAQTINALSNVSSIVENETVKTELENKINSSFAEEKSKIENSELSNFEKNKQLLALNQEYLVDITEEKGDIIKNSEENPDDGSLTQKREVIEEIESNQIATVNEMRQKAIASISEDDLKTAIVLVDKNYYDNIETLRSETSQTMNDDIANREVILQDKLEKAITDKEKEIKRKYSVSAELDKAILEKSLSESKIREQEARNAVDTSLPINTTAVSQEEFISTLRNDLIGDNSSAVTSDYTLKEELENQDEVLETYDFQLKKEIEAIKAQLNETGSEDPILNEKLTWLNNELAAVNDKRRQISMSLGALETDVIVENKETKEEYISSVRGNLIGENSNVITQVYTSKDELTTQKDLLETYEKQLKEQIKSTEKELKKSPDNAQELEDKISWLKDELIAVQTKRRQVSMSIGELETDVVAENKETQEEYINSLRTELIGENNKVVSENFSTKAELENQETILENYELQLEEEIELTEKQIKKSPENSEALEDNVTWLKNELKTVQTKRRQVSMSIGELETVLISDNSTQQDDPETSLVKAKSENEELINQLAILESQENADPIIQETKKINAIKSEEVSELIAASEKAKSSEEKEYLLNKAKEEQDAINTTIAATIIDQKRKEIEESENVKLLSQEELQTRKRRFSIQIGDLTTEIIATEKSIEEAKRKEIPVLESKKAQLIAERTMAESQLRQIEELILDEEKLVSVVSEAAANTELTFNEERKQAGTEEYKNYYTLGTDALETEREIISLERELSEERLIVNQLLSENNPDNKEKIDSSVEKIKSLTTSIDELKVDLVQKKYLADAALPINQKEAMRMQNLVYRGIKPLKVIAVAALLNMPASGFSINADTENTYTEANPIPVDVASPSGLVYRVQVGAFARPIPQDLFKQFTPVSGEKIQGTNVTRYMAGYFNNSSTVVDARRAIRELGYSDAFIVAYCDGKRIGFGDARRREANGTCVPKASNEMMVEVASKTAENLGLPTTSEVQEVSEYSYNEAPGASDADPIEVMQGLFFTVQIGVFNRPISDEVVYNLPELTTIRLGTGQIRYNTGLYNSAKAAIPRRTEALKRGIRGAFIVAYYQGERIPLGQAKKLLAENGGSILQSNMDKPVVEEVIDSNTAEVTRTDSVTIENIIPVHIEEVSTNDRVQIVTKKQFDEFPRDVLNRYNAEGAFYYDAKDKRVKSVIYENENALPRLWNFVDDIDTVFIPFSELQQFDTKILSVQIEGGIIPGDLMDWLLRFSYPREILEVKTGIELRILEVEEENVEKISSQIRTFALETVVLEETKLELEEND